MRAPKTNSTKLKSSLVKVRGENGYEHVIDLEKYPLAKGQIDSGSLTVVAELSALPRDPWKKPAATGRKAGKDDDKPENAD